MRVTRRGEVVIAVFAILLVLAVLGFAGWIEGGMQ